MITTPKGIQVPLSELVDWKYGKSLTTITHKDGDRVATISAELIGSDIGTAGKEVMQKLTELSVPNGYTVVEEETAEERGNHSSELAYILMD